MTRKFSNIHGLLVQGDDDIIGHIAYSLYKREKEAFISKVRRLP